MTLLRSLIARGYSCHVFALESNGPLRSHVINLGVPVYSGGLKKGDLSGAPWKLIASQLKLIRIIRRLRPDVVHSFLPLVTFMGALAGRLSRVSLVITSRRALGTHQERCVLLRPIDFASNFLSHHVAVNSRAVWNDVIRRDHLNPNKLVLIYNGIDIVPYEKASLMRSEMRSKMGVAPSQIVVTVIANLIPYKGHFEFLEAARLVADRMPAAVFWLVGENRGIQKELEEISFELGIHDRVRFMGQRHDIPDLLAASDLSVLPSHEEGFSNVILESMAAALPVVATWVGGNPEAVLDGVTGWLVPARNPVVMAEKIVDLLEDPERAKSWGERGRNRVKELSNIEKMVEAHVKLYEGRHQGKDARNDNISG